jgi:hypothetical protein
MLLNEKTGLVKLYQDFDKKVKFKGKGNERSDLRLLLSTYRQWCLNMCPVGARALSFFSLSLARSLLYIYIHIIYIYILYIYIYYIYTLIIYIYIQ